MLPPSLSHTTCPSPEPATLRSTTCDSDSSPTKVAEKESENLLHLPSLDEAREVWRTSRRRMMADLNDMRCQRVPLYGADLIRTVAVPMPSVEHKTGTWNWKLELNSDSKLKIKLDKYLPTHYISLYSSS